MLKILADKVSPSIRQQLDEAFVEEEDLIAGSHPSHNDLLEVANCSRGGR